MKKDEAINQLNKRKNSLQEKIKDIELKILDIEAREDDEIDQSEVGDITSLKEIGFESIELAKSAIKSGEASKFAKEKGKESMEIAKGMFNSLKGAIKK